MTDYLTALAARALGIAEVARPRASLFEPRRGAPEPLGDADPARPAAVPRASLHREDRPDAASMGPRGTPEQAPALQARPRSDGASGPAPEPSPPQPAPAPAGRRLQPRPAERAVAASPPPAHDPGPARSDTDARAQHGAAATPEPRRREPETRLEPPPLLAPRRPRVAARAEASSAPVVRVRIGRVDVRAVLPEATPEPKRNPRQAPRMSLDEYLRPTRGNGR